MCQVASSTFQLDEIIICAIFGSLIKKNEKHPGSQSAYIF